VWWTALALVALPVLLALAVATIFVAVMVGLLRGVSGG
jgi:hypothetical protein